MLWLYLGMGAIAALVYIVFWMDYFSPSDGTTDWIDGIPIFLVFLLWPAFTLVGLVIGVAWMFSRAAKGIWWVIGKLSPDSWKQ